jgi:hypothetical protein
VCPVGGGSSLLLVFERDGKLLRGGIGSTVKPSAWDGVIGILKMTVYRFSLLTSFFDSEDEDAPSPLTRH